MEVPSRRKMDNMHKQMGSNFSRNYKKESSGDATRKKKKRYVYIPKTIPEMETSADELKSKDSAAEECI